MLPKEITKNVDEIKTPSNRVLVIVLLIAVSALSTLYLKSVSNRYNDCSEEVKVKDHKIDSMQNVSRVRDDSDNVREKRQHDWDQALLKALESKGLK